MRITAHRPSTPQKARLLTGSEIAQSPAAFRDLLVFAHNNGFRIKGTNGFFENHILGKNGRHAATIFQRGKDNRKTIRTKDPVLMQFLDDRAKAGEILTKIVWYGQNTAFDYDVYPFLTEADKKALLTKAEDFNAAKVAVRGEFTLIKGSDKISIGAYIQSRFRGFLIYDPVNMLAAAGCCDFDGLDLPMTLAMKDALLREGASAANLIFAATDNIERGYRSVLNIYYDRPRFDLRGSFLFDLQELTVKALDPGSIPLNRNTDVRLLEKTKARLRHNIPWIES